MSTTRLPYHELHKAAGRLALSFAVTFGTNGGASEIVDVEYQIVFLWLYRLDDEFI
jgi:hypothetical protein